MTWRNTLTAIAKEYLLQVQREQHSKLRRMAQRLSLFTDLRKDVLDDPPRWRTHGSDRFIFTAPSNDALIFGDPTGAAYTNVVEPLDVAAARLQQLPAAAQRALRSRLATVDLTDAAVIAATHDTGQLRFSGRKKELPAIDALEAHVVDPSNEQSATAVLDKIGGAVLIGALRPAPPQRLLEPRDDGARLATLLARSYDVLPGSHRFIAIKAPAGQATSGRPGIVLVQHWSTTLASRGRQVGHMRRRPRPHGMGGASGNDRSHAGARGGECAGGASGPTGVAFPGGLAYP